MNKKDLVSTLKRYQHLKRKLEEINHKLIGLSSISNDKELGGHTDKNINDTIMLKDKVLEEMEYIESLINLVDKEPIHTVLYLHYIEGKSVYHIERFLNYSYKYGFALKKAGELMIIEKLYKS